MPQLVKKVPPAVPSPSVTLRVVPDGLRAMPEVLGVNWKARRVQGFPALSPQSFTVLPLRAANPELATTRAPLRISPVAKMPRPTPRPPPVTREAELAEVAEAVSLNKRSILTPTQPSRSALAARHHRQALLPQLVLVRQASLARSLVLGAVAATKATLVHS